MRFRLLAAAQRDVDAAKELETMFVDFPDNAEVRKVLVSWYMQRRDFDGAEAVLRKLAGADTDATDGHITVVQFLRTARGDEAANAELDRLIAANAGNTNAELYRATRAGLDFEAGNHDAAIAVMQEILASAVPSDQTRRIKLILAQMLTKVENPVGARALVEEVLAEDTTNVIALKLRASWRIADDQPDAAISDLRTALNQAPRDPSILTLLAEAHERGGDHELAGEQLALAVEASGAAADTSLRYARFLSQGGKTKQAETVLLDARRADPGNIDIVNALATIWLANQNWIAIEGLLNELQGMNTAATQKMAVSLKAAMLIGQERTDEGLALLEEQIGHGNDDASLVARLVITQIRNNDLDGARVTIDKARTDNPDDLNLRQLEATLYVAENRLDKAEETLRAMIADHPDSEAAVRLLYGVLVSTGRSDDAVAVVDAGIAARPDSIMLRLIKASLAERNGDIDGAIAIYEDLYALDTGNVMFANNLASMITSYREDPASLDRAYAIAKRLRGTKVPAFQDTYGWIEYRRGNYAGALEVLEPAAKALSTDPMTQFHLGMTYVGLDRPADAVPYLTRAIELADGKSTALPQIETARSALAAIEAKAKP